MARMTEPVRSFSCKHLQCFDSSTGRSINRNKPLWKCLVCNLEAPIARFFVDQYAAIAIACCPRFLLDILKRAGDADEVIVDTRTAKWSIPTRGQAFVEGDPPAAAIDYEELALAERVNKRAREASDRHVHLDLAEDIEDVEAIVDRRRTTDVFIRL